MRIVFGSNNFKIKSFDPYHFDLSKTPDSSDFTIEVRQKYFHLFWIPFFGIGKVWVLRKGKQLYDLPAMYADEIRKKNVPVRSPWYTFMWPILMALAFFGFIGYTKYDRERDIQGAIDHYKQKAAALSHQLTHLGTKDILTARGIKEDTKTFYLKVERINPSSVVFSKIVTDRSQDQESYSVIENYYRDFKEMLDTVTIPKTEILNAVSGKEGEIYYNQYPVAKFPSITGNYEITEVVRHFGPLITDRGTGSFGNRAFSMEMLNDGWPADLIEVKSLENPITLTTGLPLHTGAESHMFFLEGTFKDKGPYKFQLTFKDSTDQLHKYIMQGKDFDKTLTRIDD